MRFELEPGVDFPPVFLRVCLVERGVPPPDLRFACWVRAIAGRVEEGVSYMQGSGGCGSSFGGFMQADSGIKELELGGWDRCSMAKDAPGPGAVAEI